MHIILHPLFFLFMAWSLRFSAVHCWKLLSRWYGAQCSQGSDHFCIQATLAFIRVMTLSCASIYWFAVLDCWKWWMVLFWNIDHCILCWLCCWVRCWMLEDMDHMEASWDIDVKVGTFDQVEQNKIWVFAITSLGMVILTIHHDMMVSIWFM